VTSRPCCRFWVNDRDGRFMCGLSAGHAGAHEVKTQHGTAVQSRSMRKRIAIMRGEAMPTFSEPEK
jgi:hypothetical protein